MIRPSSIRFRRTSQENVTAILAEHPQLPEVVAEMLAARGYTQKDDIEAFFNPTPELLHDPCLLKDMTKACEILRSSLASGHRVLIQGDYDLSLIHI